MPDRVSPLDSVPLAGRKLPEDHLLITLTYLNELTKHISDHSYTFLAPFFC